MLHSQNAITLRPQNNKVNTQPNYSDGYKRVFFLEVFCTERCHICIEKRDETDQENKYEGVRRLDAKMKVMNECQIGLCWGIWES